MANSELSFASTQTFRNTLLAKNLAPYNIPGVYSPQVSQLAYETTLSNSNVIDSPNNLIAQSPYPQQLYPLNQYAPPGGYNLNITYNNPANVQNSNEGIYDINDTKLDLVNEFFIDASYIQNVYGPTDGFQSMVEITNVQTNNQIHQPYWSPPSFEPSSYSPYSIIIQDDPVGSSGPLSNDSFIAKLGAERLKFAFQERVGAEIFQATIGTVDLQSLSDPYEASLIVTGQQPLITKDYTITVPEFPISRAAFLLTKLSSTYFPVSPIPGDYFQENTKGGVATNQTSTALNIINALTGGFLGPILNTRRNPSQIFLANTGNGQRSVLFNNLDFNRYQPGYDRTFGGLAGIPQTIVATALSLLTGKGGYYVGSKNSEPSTITSPPNQIPVDPFGRQNPSPVYGPSELGILYEGNQGKINFGLPAKPTIDAGGITGSFVWTSPKSKGGAGYKATPGGGLGSGDEEFFQISNDYTKSQSTNIKFKKSSILDQTQRLIDSADNVSGIAKLKHVGNAINQVSKVFNDGYKEMTKGSQVVSYKDNTTGEELGIEYCRVFAKDTPYYTYSDLQKTDGITTSGRRFTYSVLDNTYNLNIAPMKGEDSTNIVKNEKGEFYAKKYMFSLENLAWRTSSRPGFTYDDLPACEKGPNGGRVMWFPPYELTFNDSSKANWNPTPFLGRPEPIYTYKDTTRDGTISWKIVVDSPSVLNTIVDKQLKGQTNKKIDSILESFFAGCVKFDIYELAKKFNTFKLSELIELQEIVSKQNLTREEVEGVLSTIPRQNVVTTSPGFEKADNATNNPVNTEAQAPEIESKFIDFAFYFENDQPGPQNATDTSTGENYETLYNKYIEQGNIDKYKEKANGIFGTSSPQADTTNFFNEFIKKNWAVFTEGENSFIKQAEAILKDGGSINMTLIGAASALSTPEYNKALSQRRISSVKNYFDKTPLKDYLQNGKFAIISEQAEGEVSIVPKSEGGSAGEIDCSKDITNQNGAVTNAANIYARDAMACRRVRVSSVKVTKGPEEKPKDVTTDTTTVKPKENGVEDANLIFPPTPQTKVDVKKKLKDGIGKRILRRLLSECDYFSMIQEQAPFVYDSIREKIKYFNPAFHSMTPEGLNARLTFLNQCVRPGETIPVIDPDGRPKYNDALNTSFGAPPILVLRIGDFYHTKIVPNNLTIQYEPLLLDMNPEGIGVQPMLAKVSLNFSFIGGHGLARPIEQLQNALSFNYYANTEIYDERAVFTEDTSKLDKQIFTELFGAEALLDIADAVEKPERKGLTTIGNIVTTVPLPGQGGQSGGETGFTTYQKVMDSALSTSKQYFSDVYNTAKKISEQYNYGIWQLITTERQFTEGNFLLNDSSSPLNPKSKKVTIFGQSKDSDKRLEFLTEKVISDIQTGTNNFIIKYMFETKNFTPDNIETLRDNLNQYMTNYIISFSAPIFAAMQTFTVFQQDMVQNFRKINVVNSSTDGKILESGKPFVYAIQGTKEVAQKTPATAAPPNTLAEVKIDYEDLANRYNNYDLFVKQSNINLIPQGYPKTKESAGIFFAFTPNLNGSSQSDKAFYMVACRIFSDPNKLIEFKNSLLKNGLKEVNKFEKKLDKACDKFRGLVKDELKQQEKYFKKIKENKEFIDFEKQDIFTKGKVRKFTYTTVMDDNDRNTRNTLITDVWKDVNVNSDKKTWEGKVKFN